MGEKDLTEKILEEHDDVFADIVNALLFGGREVIKPEELTAKSSLSAYKADGKIRELERDTAKMWRNSDVRIACIGIENQTKVDRDMPLRVLAYDGTEYRSQLLKENDCIVRYPVVTLVLYFGYEHRWNKPLSLTDTLDIPEEFKPFVSDYRINLFEIAYLTDEQLELFKSDFKVVADYFVQMRKLHEQGKAEEYVPNPQKLRHVQNVLQMMSAFTGDKRFEEAYNERLPNERVSNMCEALDRAFGRAEAKGIAKGIAEGIAIGRADSNFELLLSLVKEHYITVEVAAEKAGMTVEEFKKKGELD